MKVVWDGQLVEAHEAVIPVQEPGSAFGWGVFETLRIRHGRPCFYRDHFNRLKEGAAIIGMPFNWTGEEMLALTKRVLEANCIEEGAVKWIWLRDHEGPRLWMGPRPGTLAYLRKNEGLVLGRAKGRRNPHSALTYLKTNNWLENSLELTRARLEGWDECLFLNHRGQLCEGAMSNIFFFKEDKLCTPALECGLLPGIMRRKVMEEASRIGWEVEEGGYDLGDLREAQEVFLTNALLGVAPVARFEGVKLTGGFKRAETLDRLIENRPREEDE